MADYGHLIERTMTMSDEVWLRHANPWSVWTRIATAPVLFLALWSLYWIGWWALLPIALVAVWAWLNPRIFPIPRHTDSWASKGVFGERVWLNRANVPIPREFARLAHGLNAAQVPALLVTLHGFLSRDLLVALLGYTLMIVLKLWFVDRMAWLFERMKDADPAYRAWLR